MERAALLRSLSSSRCFSRSSPSLLLFSRSSCSSSSAPFHYRRSISYPTRRSVLRRHFRLVPAALPSLSLNLRKHFSSVCPRAVASPPFPSTPGMRNLLALTCDIDITCFEVKFVLSGALNGFLFLFICICW